jgi:catechol 2,3-dioxygenase-like lactoylglutathione lyase family enzyme
MELKRLTPMINVSDIERSLEFYRSALGFKLCSSEEAVKEWRWAEIESGGLEKCWFNYRGKHEFAGEHLSRSLQFFITNAR